MKATLITGALLVSFALAAPAGFAAADDHCTGDTDVAAACLSGDPTEGRWCQEVWVMGDQVHSVSHCVERLEPLAPRSTHCEPEAGEGVFQFCTSGNCFWYILLGEPSIRYCY